MENYHYLRLQIETHATLPYILYLRLLNGRNGIHIETPVSFNDGKLLHYLKISRCACLDGISDISNNSCSSGAHGQPLNVMKKSAVVRAWMGYQISATTAAAAVHMDNR